MRHIDLYTGILQQAKVFVNDENLNVVAVSVGYQKKPAGWIYHKITGVHTHRLVAVFCKLAIARNFIHSNIVCRAQVGKQTGDALVTNQKNIAIAVGAADCYPVLFYDEKNKVIGAAHCGWKGTLAKIVKNTINEMVLLGAEINEIKVAIGQGICKANYQVSEDVIQQFSDAGFSSDCWEGRQLDLLQANRFVALESGIKPESIWSMNRCTTEDDFFSYRREIGRAHV